MRAALLPPPLDTRVMGTMLLPLEDHWSMVEQKIHQKHECPPARATLVVAVLQHRAAAVGDESGNGGRTIRWESTRACQTRGERGLLRTLGRSDAQGMSITPPRRGLISPR